MIFNFKFLIPHSKLKKIPPRSTGIFHFKFLIPHSKFLIAFQRHGDFVTVGELRTVDAFFPDFVRQ